MSDDLVKRLRDHIAVSFDDRGHVFEDETLCDDAADRIEELEAKLAKVVEVAEKSIRWLRLYGVDVHREAVTLTELGEDNA